MFDLKSRRALIRILGITFILFGIFFQSTAVSQDVPDDFTRRNRGAQYFLGEEDELLIKVNVLGFVRKPGQYLVPTDTDLISLLSFVGGPLEDANTKHVKLVRSDKNSGKVIDINVKKYLQTADDKIIPDILPGDTIVVSASKWYYVNKFFEFTSRVAVLTQMVWYFTLIRDK